MPISAEKMCRYPGGSIRSKEWRAFRATILERARDACEGTPNRPHCRASNGKPHPETFSRVVLTIAHMDWDETHADPERCRALCQLCHNDWDKDQRRINAMATRRNKRAAYDFIAELCE